MTAEAVGPGFLRKPAWVLWSELVSREIKGQATPHEAHQVREPAHLVAWLRALNQIRAEVQTQDADARLRLKAHAPLPGKPATEHYLEQKRVYDDRHAGRIRFMRGVEARIAECHHLIETEGITPATTLGGLVGALGLVEELLQRDDIDGALGVARAALDRVEREAQ